MDNKELTNKQTMLTILMEAIDIKCKNIAILYKYDNKLRNTLIIEPIENIGELIKDILAKYNDNLYSDEYKNKILSALPFTDGYPDDEENVLLYAEIIEGIKENIIGCDIK